MVTHGVVEAASPWSEARCSPAGPALLDHSTLILVRALPEAAHKDLTNTCFVASLCHTLVFSLPGADGISPRFPSRFPCISQVHGHPIPPV